MVHRSFLCTMCLAGLLGCGASPEPECDAIGALGPDVRGAGWVAEVRPWALARPADSLIHPILQYYEVVTSEDQVLLTTAGGAVLDLEASTNTLTAEFRAADFASALATHEEQFEARIAQVNFGYELCQY